MGRNDRRRTSASAAMGFQADLSRPTASASPAGPMQPPPLKRSRTSGQLPGAARMIQSYSTPFATPFAAPFAAPFDMHFSPSFSPPPAFCNTSPNACFDVQSDIGSDYYDVVPGQTSAQSVFYAMHGQSDLVPSAVNDSGMNPVQFLQTRGISLAQPQASSFLPSGSMSSDTLAFDDYGQGHSLPSLDSMTEAATLETDLSRQVGENYNDSASLPLEMTHSNSQASFIEQAAFDDADLLGKYQNDVRFAGFMHQSAFFPAASAGVYQEAQLPSANMERSESADSLASVDLPGPSTVQAASDSIPQLQPNFSEDMCRALSNTSTRSTSSRAKSSLLRQLDNGKIPLQPKCSSRDESDNASNTGLLADVAKTMSDGVSSSNTVRSLSSRKVEIEKAKQEKPKTLRLFCDLCNKYPRGFRGDHELRRHKDNKHSDNPRRWICYDPREDGVDVTIKPFQPIAGCRKCREPRLYAQEYNASEHLRRVHFSPKAHRKGSKSGACGSKDATTGSHRGSTNHQSGEGRQLIPGAELKKWIKEFDASDAVLQSDFSADGHGNEDSRDMGAAGDFKDNGGTSHDQGHGNDFGDAGGDYLTNPLGVTYQRLSASPMADSWYHNGLLMESMELRYFSPLTGTQDSTGAHHHRPGSSPYFDPASPSGMIFPSVEGHGLGYDNNSDLSTQSSSPLFDPEFDPQNLPFDDDQAI